MCGDGRICGTGMHTNQLDFFYASGATGDIQPCTDASKYLAGRYRQMGKNPYYPWIYFQAYNSSDFDVWTWNHASTCSAT